MRTRFFFIPVLHFSFIAIFPAIVFAQNKEVLQSADSLKTVTATIDTTTKKIKKVKVYDPRKAAIRSAILPGWGQVYNKKYWKLPIVYGALGASAGIFVFNLQTYKDTRKAYAIKYNMSLPTATAADSARYSEIPDYLKPISIGSLRSYRDSYRRDIDYSVLFFVLLWGLNVVDAAVDAHLKSFDVSPDLSLRFKPGYSPMAGTTGMSLVFNIGKKKEPVLLASRF
jgi:hypothetical protein